ncbi:hypothetical protein V9T40_001228 [Parthenolecanium corni]|uniref:Uncharacterized protein n=1 Tax=Parthenolecanium corni TaxID=536013 RepID=A0AAN9TEK0_9HEMI
MCFLGGRVPPPLYVICLKTIIKLLRNGLEKCDEDEARRASKDLFRKTGIRVANDVMLTAFHGNFWTEISTIFSYLKLPAVICDWSPPILEQIKVHQTAKQILITNPPRTLRAEDVLAMVGNSASVDFEGELFWRSQPFENRLKQTFENEHESWLSSSQNVIRIMHCAYEKIPKYLSKDYQAEGLLELHLGMVNISIDELAKLLQKLPSLILLRSYKMVKALYYLHSQDWKNGKLLKKYQLQNLDADFSYVACCTLTVDRMLPMDALQLATELCPEAIHVRVRFDCSTHHGILEPLVGLKKLKHLSAVCVTNGELSLLDFTDIEPVLQQHGEQLRFLELKVIDAVDIHKIINSCPKLETLVLSGNDYVTPKCSNQCSSSVVSKLRKLKILFFAEGGDVVSKNYVPSCFWYSTLLPSSGLNNGWQNELRGVNGRQKSYVCNCANKNNNNDDNNNVSGNNVVCQISTLITTA